MDEKQTLILAEPTMKGLVNPKTGTVYVRGEQIKTRSSSIESLLCTGDCRTVFRDFLIGLANADDPVQYFYNSSVTATMVDEFQRNGNH